MTEMGVLSVDEPPVPKATTALFTAVTQIVVFGPHLGQGLSCGPEIDNIVTDSMQLLSGLEFTLRQGLPQEKLVALRQCIERIWIDKPAGTIKLAIRLVPVGNLQATQELKTPV